MFSAEGSCELIWHGQGCPLFEVVHPTFPLPAEGSCEQFWHGQGCPLFDVVRVAFPLPTAALPTLEGALKDSFREAVVVCDMPEPCTFPSLSFKSQETIVYQTATDYRRQIC